MARETRRAPGPVSILSALAFALAAGHAPAGELSPDTKAAITKSAHAAVLDELLSPSSANFVFTEVSRHSSQADAYTVVGDLDAQNFFGADMRSAYWVNVEAFCADLADSACWIATYVFIDRPPIRKYPF